MRELYDLMADRRTILAWAAFAAVASGCCASHAPERDAGGEPDVGTPPIFWRLESRSIVIRAAGDPYTSYCFAEGQTAFVEATVTLSPDCEHAGPVNVVVDAPGRLVQLSANVWIEYGAPCVAAAVDVDRSVAIAGLTSGLWDVVDTVGGGRIVVNVAGPPPPVTCTSPGAEGATCAVDCDCSNGVPCVSSYGPRACNALCARSCVEDLDCLPGETCAASYHDRYAGSLCSVTSGSGQCATDMNCPAGFGCFVSPVDWQYCDWTLALSASARHGCETESECNAGLHCVQHADGARTCEIPCWSDAMRCPSGYGCEPTATLEPPRSVCALRN